MPLRDLLCVIEPVEDAETAALGQSIALARENEAMLSVLVAGPKASAPYSLFNAGTVNELLMSENRKVHERTEAVVAKAKAGIAEARVKGAVESCLDAFPDVLARVRRQAATHDVAIIDRPRGIVGHGEILFEEILFSTGRPVLLPASDANPGGRFRKLLLAWDGSPCATRALSAALCFFGGLEETDVVVVHGEKNLSGMVPAAEIAAHIERHGIEAKVVELQLDEEGVSSTIDRHAIKAGADLVAMGAFGRSRLREFVLGGVTRDLTRFSSRPLLLAH